MPIFLIAILLGIIEGITEFLPISSTGHLILAQRLTGFQDVEEVFTVVIQLGAISAVIWFYRHDLLTKIRGLLAQDQAAINFWKLLVVATVPAGLIGLLLERHMDSIATPTVIAWSLIIGGVILWLVDNKPVDPDKKIEPKIERISLKQAIIVGFGQAVAIIPGVSRSGATIVTGLSLGIDRATATAFSFYLSIPVMVLASSYKLIKNPEAVGQISGGPLTLLLGVASAFITALLAISWLLRYVSRHNYRPFAYYRVAIGTVILFVVK